MTLDAGENKVSVESSSQGETERATLYRKGHEPPSSGFAGTAAWPRVVGYRKIYTSPVRSLQLEPVWSHDGSKILVRTSWGREGQPALDICNEWTAARCDEGPDRLGPFFLKDIRADCILLEKRDEG